MTNTTDSAVDPRAELLYMPQGAWGPRQLILIFALVFAIWHVLTNVYLT